MPQLDILFKESRWRRIPKLRQQLERAATCTLELLPKRYLFPVTVSLLLTDNKSIRKLNCDFRGMDKPTNVLSFPQYEPADFAKKSKDKEPKELGDVVLAYQYVVDEASNTHKILINHIIHLFIHGLLHLFGYDHLSDKDANRMERLEKQIMAKLQLPDPYQIQGPIKGRQRSPKTKRTLKRAK